MDLGFDEFGRPTGRHQTALHTDEHESEDARARTPNPLIDSDSDAFSDDVEVVDGEEATEDITKATVVASSAGPSSRQRTHAGLLIEDRHVQRDAPVANFVGMVSSIPQRLRSVGVVGALHHGKTSFLSMITSSDGSSVPYRQRKDEISRKMSLKTSLVSVMVAGTVLGGTPSSLATFIDTPGHPSLTCEAAAGLRLADSVLVCVDAVEGVIAQSERLVRMCALESLPIGLVITKLDRLILDLRLPPTDAYRKLRGIIDTVNNVIASSGSKAFVSPTLGTVLFSSSKLQLCFTLETFAKQYLASLPGRVTATPSALAKKFWGNNAYIKEAKSFQKCANVGGMGQPKPSFVEFILEPVYKVVAHSITGKAHQALAQELCRSPAGPLAAAKEAIRHFLGDAHQVAVSAVLNITPHSIQRSSFLLGRVCGSHVRGCVALCPMQRIHTDTRSFHVVKILSGTLSIGTTFAVMEEAAGDDEPYYESQFESLFIKTPDGLVEVSSAHAGQVVLALPRGSGRSSRNYVLFQSTDGAIDEQRQDCVDAINDLMVFPLAHDPPRVLVSVEPVEPSQAAALRQGMLRMLSTSPGLDVRAEETGEFTICGFGEVHLDAALNELRSVFCEKIPIKLSAPFVSFAETVSSARGVLALAGSSGGGGARSHHVGVVSGSLSSTLANSLEEQAVEEIGDIWDNSIVKGTDRWSARKKYLREHCQWDALDSQRLLAVGPDLRGPNILIDDVVEEEDLLKPDGDRAMNPATKAAVVQGFQNALRHGPLCGEPVREVTSRITFLAVPARPNTEAQTALLTRQAVTQSLFGARLQLMEPVYAVEMIATPWRMDAVREILQMRRGAVLSETPIPATPLSLVKASMPVIDSFGFETQLRMTTVGEVYCTASFGHWDAVPGDPLDSTIQLDTLEPARGFQLARDFVLKTRYRKGLTGEIVVPQ